ncbi:MAG: right-handed parallel beta-helix repeat-containing protein [Methanotrichaceae archaeon]|nr:right-handed parallel beta-helix repeat-containing protein [Methanotrichaceae archaeon]
MSYARIASNASFVLSILMLSASGLVYVQPDESIQQAVDLASPGEVVQIMAGTYEEWITLNKSIVLRGSNEGAMPIIDAQGGDIALSILADGVEVRGLTIANAQVAGIAIYSSGVVIGGNEVVDCAEGISIQGGDNMIERNVVRENSHGIVLHNSENNTVLANDLIENRAQLGGDCGIVLRRSNNNSIWKNNISSSGNCAISLVSSEKNSILGNNVSGNAWYGIYLTEMSNENDIRENAVAENGRGGICLEDSRENVVQSNIVRANGKGIILTYDSYRNTLRNNTVEENGRGIHLAFHSNDNLIEGNAILQNEYGIYLTFSTARNLIVGNRLVENGYNAYDEGIRNRWDDGTIGNYYSDLETVYNIPGSESVDRHPQRA